MLNVFNKNLFAGEHRGIGFNPFQVEPLPPPPVASLFTYVDSAGDIYVDSNADVYVGLTT